MRTNDSARSTLALERSKAWRRPDIDAPAGEGKESPVSLSTVAQSVSLEGCELAELSIDVVRRDHPELMAWLETMSVPAMKEVMYG